MTAKIVKDLPVETLRVRVYPNHPTLHPRTTQYKVCGDYIYSSDELFYPPSVMEALEKVLKKKYGATKIDSWHTHDSTASVYYWKHDPEKVKELRANAKQLAKDELEAAKANLRKVS